jgi:hypothetical protein
MATYKEIQAYVKKTYDFIPKTCWIADAKVRYGLFVEKAPNRISGKRTNPCPENKVAAIFAAFKHFNIKQ